MSGLFDASQLTAFGDALLAKGVARRALISASVKKGAQNVKNSIRDDLNGSGNAAFRRIPISYTLSETPGRISAEIGPTKGGPGAGANLAYFGTSRGGGTVEDPIEALLREAPEVERRLSDLYGGLL